MTKEYRRLFFRRKTSLTIMLTLQICRCFQLMIQHAPNNTLDVFTNFNFPNVFVVILTPIYALWIFQGSLFLQHPTFILHHKNRQDWITNYWKITIFESVSFAFISNLVVYAMLFFTSDFTKYVFYFLLNFLFEILFLINCSLLHFLITSLSKNQVLGFLGVIFYAAWDSFAESFPNLHLPTISVCRFVFSPDLAIGSIVVNGCVLMGIAILLFFVCQFVACSLDLFGKENTDE